MTREEALRLDEADPLAACADRFVLPPGLIYLDGNSLGPLPRATIERVSRVMEEEWGQSLIRAWNQHRWIDLPRHVAAKIAPLIGAREHEVMVADSTSVNLYKLLAAALELASDRDRGRRPGRHKILSSPRNFPSDLYMMQGLARWLGRAERAGGSRPAVGPAGPDASASLEGAAARGAYELVLADDPAAVLDDSVAVLALTHVDFKSGELFDLPSLTAAAHAAGALVIWDLCHSAGAVPVDLGAASADFAVGCGYKYLNGGPGAPAFLYVAERHQEAVSSPLCGWLGHAEPFAFDTTYRPAPGIGRFLCGTPPILSLAALDAGLDSFASVDLAALRAKSMALGDLFLELVDERCAGHGFRHLSPRDAHRRGSQVSLAHPEGYAIIQALIARGVIGDFRAPDVLRFGLAPLYLRYADVWDAVEALRLVMEGREWGREERQRRGVVT